MRAVARAGGGRGANAGRCRGRRCDVARRRVGRAVHRGHGARSSTTARRPAPAHDQEADLRRRRAAHEHARARRRRTRAAAGSPSSTNDLYLPQDLLNRRAAPGAAPSAACGSTRSRSPSSHNHNTPFYSTPGWGTAIFQDVMDVRFYEYMADAHGRRRPAGQRPARPGADGRDDAALRRSPGPHLRAEGRRRRHARRPAVRPHDQAAQRPALRRHLRSGEAQAAGQLGRLRPAPRVHLGLRPHQRRLHPCGGADGRSRARLGQPLQPARDRQLRPAQGPPRARAGGPARVRGQRLRPARPRRATDRRRDQGGAAATSRTGTPQFPELLPAVRRELRRSRRSRSASPRRHAAVPRRVQLQHLRPVPRRPAHPGARLARLRAARDEYRAGLRRGRSGDRPALRPAQGARRARSPRRTRALR